MAEKVFKIHGAVFAAGAFISLFSPWFYAYFEGELVSANMTTMGFSLAEFSAWGTIILIFPIMLLGIAYSKFSDKTKTVSFLAMYLFGSISFYYAASIGMEWLIENSTEYVRPCVGIFLYPIFIFFSLLSFYLSCNVKCFSLLGRMGLEDDDEDASDV